MAKNDSRTKAFSTTAKPKPKKKSYKSKKRIRQQVVLSIFAVIALILVVFATLIIGKIITLKKAKDKEPNTQQSVYTVGRNELDVHIGNLLLINDNYKYTLPADLSGMINVYQYRQNSDNNNTTQIDGDFTYALTSNKITLNKDTLNAFNQMILDYCSQPNFESENNNSISNLEIAWGGYSESTRVEYEDDIEKYGKDYYDHALGTTLTIKINTPSTVVTESILKTNFDWINKNAHKYGFIVRYTSKCQNHTGIDSSKRVHFRYVGVEHATYIYENNICFEEYLGLIRENHNSNNPLEFTANGKTYNVYYVAYSGNPTNIPVPEDKTYYISGDNMNGFIVTVEK